MIKEIIDTTKKSTICNQILKALPAWFGIEDSIVEYVHDVENMVFYAYFDSSQPIGFVAIKTHNIYTAEIYVMGILKKYHRQGIGRELIKAAEAYCLKEEIKCLTVKTLAETVKNEAYANTRSFYARQGFIPLEVFPDLWGATNPCLMLVKLIDKREAI